MSTSSKPLEEPSAERSGALPKTREASFVSRAGALWLAGSLGLFLALPSFAVGFFTDDYSFTARLHSRLSPGPFDLFRFASGKPEESAWLIGRGYLPWWTTPELRIHFLRPLTSAWFALDVHLFGAQPFGYHVDSLLWYAALLVGIGLLYRRVLSSGAAFWGLLLFAFRAAHVAAYAWISARHVLIAAVLVVAALVARVSLRHGRWVAAALLVLALSASESALIGVAFLVAYELWGSARRRENWVSAGAFAGLSVIYLVVYKTAGGGTRASGGYHDPLSDPAGFLKLAITRVPVLVGDALLGVPAELANIGWGRGLAIVGVMGVVIIGAGYWAFRSVIARDDERVLKWLLVGAFAGCLVGATGFPGGRVLLLPDVGFAALLGVVLDGALRTPRRATGAVLAGLLILLHVVLAPLRALHDERKMAHRARAAEAIASDAATLSSDGNFLLLASSDPLVYLYPRGILSDLQPGKIRCWSVLSAARSSHRLKRTSANSFELTMLDEPLLTGFDTLFRDDHHLLAVGDEVHQCKLNIRVTEIKNGKPSLLTIESDQPIDQLPWTIWRNHQLERFTMPAIGETAELPWSSGPSGAL